MGINVTPSKETILKKIRQALSDSTPLPFPQSEGTQAIFQPSKQELELEFAEQFTKLNGKFAYCAGTAELKQQLGQLIVNLEWKKLYWREASSALGRLLDETIPSEIRSNDLATCDASITSCECLVARTGSMLLSAALPSGRTSSVYAPVHICIAYTSQLVYDVKDALVKVKEKYQGQMPSLISLATGPSRTADIEKTLVVGVHGPREVYCFLVED